MALPSSGAISLNQMHVEAAGSVASETSVSLNDSDIRGLIGKGSATDMDFSEWYGSDSLESVSFDVIAGGGGGGSGMNNGAGTGGLVDGSDGGNSTFTITHSGTTILGRASAGGTGGAASSLGHSDDNSGEASIFGAGGANSGKENNGNPAPATSYGAGGGGGGGRRQTNFFGSVYNTDPGGAGGTAGDRNQGSDSVNIYTGSVLTIVVGAKGIGGVDPNGGTNGGAGATGRASITVGGSTYTYTNPGTYTINL
jgi:hypothetical protein